MTNEQREAEIAALQAKMRAREGMQGYAANVAAIKARIDELKRETP